MPADVQAKMEESFSADFSNVRIHEDGEAESLGALAFTRGTDIHFAPGQYKPTDQKGQELLGHELTHVMQQSRGQVDAPTQAKGGRVINDDATLEREADEMGRRAALGQRVSISASSSAPSGCPAGLVQAKLGPTAAELDSVKINASHESESIALWDGDTDVSTKGALMRSDGEATAHFGSEVEAIAWIAARSDAGAVFLENGRYVPYQVETDAIFFSFNWDNIRYDESEPWTSVRFTGAARVIVTEDGVAIRASQYKTEGDARGVDGDESLMPGADGDLAGHRSLIGDDNAKDMDKDEFLDAFAMAMKSSALAAVHRARAEADRYLERASEQVCGGSMSRQEIALMRKTAQDAAQLQEEYDAVPDLTAAIVMSGMGQGMHRMGPNSYQIELMSEQREHDKVREELRTRQREVLARYPMLARVLDDIEDFAQLDEAEQLEQLGGEAASVVSDIDETRENIIDGSLDLWIHRNIVESTLAGLGITDETKRQWALEKSQSEKSWDTAGQVAMTVFALGFGVAAAFFSGGLSLGLAAGALGLGTADAIMQTEQYMVDSSAGNTHLDPDQSIVPPDLAGHWGWLVVAWVGVGLDAADVIRAVKAIQGAGGAIDEGIQLLARGDEALQNQLRVAARHELTPDDLVTLENKDIIGRQLGARVELDDSLGKEVRVHYEVDVRGRVGVTRVIMGSGASVLEALAHAEVVRLLERYRGVQGKLRQLWDRMRSFAGKASPDVNPFPPGTRAYESWLELKKLPSIIEARRAKLGTELDKTKEALLRQDVEFLEGELKHHQQVVDQLTLEKGVGFVARAEESTRDAIAWGLPRLDSDPAMIADPTKYYYRTAPDSTPPFVLRRHNDAEAPPRSVIDEGGRWIFAEGDMSRTERAAAWIASWDDAVQEAFERVKSAFPDDKVVPLQGVATTGIRLGDHLDGVSGEILAILTRAAQNAGEVNPAQVAEEYLSKLSDHHITVVKGTDQLRAYNYRLNFRGEKPEKDLHHIIPLYLGGDHKLLANVNAGDHSRLHTIFEKVVKLPDGTTLAPHFMQDQSRFLFEQGAGVLHSDGSVTLVQLKANGTYITVE